MTPDDVFKAIFAADAMMQQLKSDPNGTKNLDQIRGIIKVLQAVLECRPST